MINWNTIYGQIPDGSAEIIGKILILYFPLYKKLVLDNAWIKLENNGV